MKKENLKMLGGGILIGILAFLLTHFGNPRNMGLCIACFLRDITGALQFHQASSVQYIRPEIIGIILGAFGSSVLSKDFKSRGGSSPLLRFFFGIFMMIGALVFLGCPFRLVLRLAGGDLNAVIGLFGFMAGIYLGSIFLKRGYSLTASRPQSKASSVLMPLFAVFLLALLLLKPAFLMFSTEGPGSMTAPVMISLLVGLITGVILQRSRICSTGAFRDIFLIRNFHFFYGIVGIFLGSFVLNLLTHKVHISFVNQPIAHSDHLWNFLGLFLVGLIGVLLGGCPIRQLVLSADGDSDAGITVLGLMAGAAIAHNFGLASSAEGSTLGGQLATLLGLAFVILVVLSRIKEAD